MNYELWFTLFLLQDIFFTRTVGVTFCFLTNCEFLILGGLSSRKKLRGVYYFYLFFFLFWNSSVFNLKTLHYDVQIWTQFSNKNKQIKNDWIKISKLIKNVSFHFLINNHICSWHFATKSINLSNISPILFLILQQKILNFVNFSNQKSQKLEFCNNLTLNFSWFKKYSNKQTNKTKHKIWTPHMLLFTPQQQKHKVFFWKYFDKWIFIQTNRVISTDEYKFRGLGSTTTINDFWQFFFSSSHLKVIREPKRVKTS